MFRKRFLKISLLLPLLAVSSAALAGATISDKRYWPNEAAARAPNAGTQNNASSAFASTVTAPRVQHALMPSAGNMNRYGGGPKSLR